MERFATVNKVTEWGDGSGSYSRGSSGVGGGMPCSPRRCLRFAWQTPTDNAAVRFLHGSPTARFRPTGGYGRTLVSCPHAANYGIGIIRSRYLRQERPECALAETGVAKKRPTATVSPEW